MIDNCLRKNIAMDASKPMTHNDNGIDSAWKTTAADAQQRDRQQQPKIEKFQSKRIILNSMVILAPANDIHAKVNIENAA